MKEGLSNDAKKRLLAYKKILTGDISALILTKGKFNPRFGYVLEHF
jgi:hypothetical protein